MKLEVTNSSLNYFGKDRIGSHVTCAIWEFLPAFTELTIDCNELAQPLRSFNITETSFHD